MHIFVRYNMAVRIADVKNDCNIFALKHRIQSRKLHARKPTIFVMLLLTILIINCVMTDVEKKQNMVG